MVIPFAIRGMAFANAQGIVACLPFPVNSPSHSHSLKIPWGGGGFNHSNPGGVLVHVYFLKIKMLILERLKHLKKSSFFDANCLSDSLAIPRNKIALTRKVLSNSSFPFPFPQSFQKRDWIIPRFPFPQDLGEWPSLSFRKLTFGCRPHPGKLCGIQVLWFSKNKSQIHWNRTSLPPTSRLSKCRLT